MVIIKYFKNILYIAIVVEVITIVITIGNIPILDIKDEKYNII